MVIHRSGSVAVLTALLLCIPSNAAGADTVITGEGILMPSGSTARLLRGEFCRIPCQTVSSLPVSISWQAILLDEAVHDTPGPVTVMGYSLSAAAIHQLVRHWVDDPGAAPDPAQARLVTLADPYTKWSGSNRDGRTSPLPASQPYRHLDVVLQYDLVADKPTRWGWYSFINSLGSSRHSAYANVDVNDPDNLVYQEGKTTYMLVEAETLPLLKWREWFTSDEEMARLDAEYRPLVEKDYDRPDYVRQGEGADWANGIVPESLADTTSGEAGTVDHGTSEISTDASLPPLAADESTTTTDAPAAFSPTDSSRRQQESGHEESNAGEVETDQQHSAAPERDASPR